MQKQFYVYILTNKSNTLYTGVTNDLNRRIYEHKNKLVDGFTKKYNIDKLIYYEVFNNPKEAIMAEKQIKGWTRKKKIELIKSKNPTFKDLTKNLYCHSERSEESLAPACRQGRNARQHF